MKYAIAQTSGKQFLLKPGQWYDVDFIKNGNVGDYIYLNKILFFRNENKIQIGKPFLTNSQIPAKIIQSAKISSRGSNPMGQGHPHLNKNRLSSGEISRFG